MGSTEIINTHIINCNIFGNYGYYYCSINISVLVIIPPYVTYMCARTRVYTHTHISPLSTRHHEIWSQSTRVEKTRRKQASKSKQYTISSKHCLNFI